jgi:DNA-binding transcriptional MocR family regulator
MLSTGKAHQLLKIAEQHRLIIVEDDIFADFADRAGPRLAALDGLQQVIAIGSFSKTISASIRCGYIAARRDWIENLTDIKIATCFSGGGFTAAVIDRVLRDGGYRKHAQGLRTRLALAMGKTAARLRALHIEPWADTRAGMFMWAKLPGGIDSAAVAKAALPRGVILAPGNVFSVSQTATSFMRFNAAQSLSPKVFDVLEAALRGASG